MLIKFIWLVISFALLKELSSQLTQHDSYDTTEYEILKKEIEKGTTPESLLLQYLRSPIISIPVFFICYGNIPEYLLYNIEITATYNPVIVLSNSYPSVWTPLLNNISSNASKSSKKIIFYVPIQKYSFDSSNFEKHYRPVRIHSDSANRQRYELQCIERWLVLRSFAAEYNVSRIFYGDNDNVLFGNITSAVLERRWLHYFDNGTEAYDKMTSPRCESIVSVEGHMSEHNFVGTVAGHSSYWTLFALNDLAEFILDLYRHDAYINAVSLQHIQSELIKRRGGDRVVDMTLLYLWWTAHHNLTDVGWDTGRPRRAHETPTADKMDAVRKSDDGKFIQTKTRLPLPPVLYEHLKVCNGLDVYERAAFDHMWGFESWNTNFTFNLFPSKSKLESGKSVEQQFLPYFIGSSLKMGGKPESLDPKVIQRLQKERLYLYNIHYQAGHLKPYIKFDVCRRLLSKANYLMLKHSHMVDKDDVDSKEFEDMDSSVIQFLLNQIQNQKVRDGCIAISKQKKSDWPHFDKFPGCIQHEMDGIRPTTCV